VVAAVLVNLLVDADPLIQSNNRGWWSCVMSAKDVELV
jgi:hypothetical protein